MMSSIRCSFLALLLMAFNAAADDAARRQQQELLDAQCYQARQLRIAPLRAEAIAECVQTQQRESNPQAFCERFYADFGERAGNRPAMFMDLPECVAAFEFQQSNRSGR